MKENFSKEEIDIIVTAMLHELERYNTVLTMVSDEEASKAVENAKHKVFEVFKKVNAYTED